MYKIIHKLISVLSVNIAPQAGYVLSSAADAIIAKHAINSDSDGTTQPTNMTSNDAPHTTNMSNDSTTHPTNTSNADTNIFNTRHAGQQSLSIRSDERVFATCGWDGRVRIYSFKTGKTKCVLHWHRDGVNVCIFGTDLSQLVIAGKDNVISVWNINF